MFARGKRFTKRFQIRYVSFKHNFLNLTEKNNFIVAMFQNSNWSVDVGNWCQTFKIKAYLKVVHEFAFSTFDWIIIN